MRSEVIITTYNSPDALNLVLCALRAQTRLPDSVAIADDGSGPQTKALIESYKQHLPMRHVWHADTGFNKNVILNKSIATSDADFLIFIDGDCLASPKFIARHMQLAHPERFSTGSVVRLHEATTKAIDETLVTSQQVFDLNWLKEHGELSGLSQRLKAGRAPRPLAALMDRFSPVRITWSGGNASTYRHNLIKVNGFDETMCYGGEDKELGARLLNAGIKGQFLRYSAPLLHMHHERSYVDPEIVASNRDKINDTRRRSRTWAETGLAQYL